MGLSLESQANGREPAEDLPRLARTNSSLLSGALLFAQLHTARVPAVEALAHLILHVLLRGRTMRVPA